MARTIQHSLKPTSGTAALTSGTTIDIYGGPGRMGSGEPVPWPVASTDLTVAGGGDYQVWIGTSSGPVTQINATWVSAHRVQVNAAISATDWIWFVAANQPDAVVRFAIWWDTSKSSGFNPSVSLDGGGDVTWHYGNGTAPVSGAAPGSYTYPSTARKGGCVILADATTLSGVFFNGKSLHGVDFGGAAPVNADTFNWFSNANLTSLPSHAGVTAIEVFRAHACNLSALPAFGDLSATKVLRAFGNTSLPALPAGLEGVTTLTDLHVGLTAITSLPDITGSLALAGCYVYSTNLSRAEVNELINGLWATRASRVALSLQIQGITAGFSGRYIAPPAAGVSNSNWLWNSGLSRHDPQTPGAKLYHAVNDPYAEGFPAWTVSYTANAQAAPVAALSTSTEGLTVTATDASTDANDEIPYITVDWGDGDTETYWPTDGAESISHTYASADTYTITWTASDGTATNATTQDVTVESTAVAVDGIDSTRARTSSIGTATPHVSADSIDNARTRLSSIGTASHTIAADGVDNARARQSSIGTAAHTITAAGIPSERARQSSIGTVTVNAAADGIDSTRGRASSVGTALSNPLSVGINATRARRSSVGSVGSSVMAPGINSERARLSETGTADFAISAEGIDSTRERASSTGTATPRAAAAGTDSTRARQSSVGSVSVNGIAAGQSSTRARVSSTGTVFTHTSAAGVNSARARRSSIGTPVSTSTAAGINSTRGRASSTGTVAAHASASGLASTRTRRQSIGTATPGTAAPGLNATRTRVSSIGTATYAPPVAIGRPSTRARISSVGTTVPTTYLPAIDNRRARRSNVGTVRHVVAMDRFPASRVVRCVHRRSGINAA